MGLFAVIAIIGLLAIIGAILLLKQGLKDASEMPAYPAFSNDEMIFQSELDKKCPDKMSPEDKILSDKIDEWGKKTFGRKPEFRDRNDEEVDTNFMSGLIN